MGFRQVVQPVLDKQCVTCHDGSTKTGKSFDLRGLRMVEAPSGYDRDEGPQHYVSDSFLRLLPFVDYVKVGGYHGEKLPLAVGATGSRASKLMRMLRQGSHHDVRLEAAEWRALAAWIDCNAPYYGDWDEIVIGSDVKTHEPSVLRSPTAKDRARIAARKSQLVDQLDNHRLLAYLDCGIQLESEPGPGRVRIRQTRGTGWQFDKNKQADRINSQADVAFDGDRVEFLLSGLSPEKSYKLTLSWWDYDSNLRRQSVWTRSPNGRKTRLLPATPLPSFSKDQHLPTEVTMTLTGDKQTVIEIRREGGSNVVVGEIWLAEAKR